MLKSKQLIRDHHLNEEHSAQFTTQRDMVHTIKVGGYVAGCFLIENIKIG